MYMCIYTYTYVYIALESAKVIALENMYRCIHKYVQKYITLECKSDSLGHLTDDHM